MSALRLSFAAAAFALGVATLPLAASAQPTATPSAAPAPAMSASAAPAASASPSAAPAAAASEAPAAAPAPAATAAPKKPVGAQRENFVVGDYVISPTIYNEATSGHSGHPSYSLRSATEFLVDNMPFMIEAEIRDWSYTHFAGPPGNCAFVIGCITNIGHTGQIYRPARNLHETDTDGRIGFRIAWPRIYAVIGYLGKAETLNYPISNGLGIGIEKLPDFEKVWTIYGSGYYYPDLESKFTVFNRTTGVSTIYTLTYHVIRYQAGVMISPFNNHQAFIDLGVLGDGAHAGNAAPGSQTHIGEYVGAGLFWP